MPELPEVEQARRVLQEAVVGRRIARLRALHPAHRRRLTAARARAARQRLVESVERRGKYQLLHLSGGWMLLAHFRMTGDWEVGSTAQPPPVHARVLVEFDDGVRLALIDPRALSTVTLHHPGEEPLPELGPDPLSDVFDGVWLRSALRGRRIPIKVALLDQRVAAGVGNIYAAEALWVARVDPRRPAAKVSAARLDRIVESVRKVLRFASGERRYAYGARDDFAVYGRVGEPCPRCGTRIRRLLQAGRSTFFCPRCQRS